MLPPAERDDELQLLTRVRDGDAAAFEMLVRQYHPELFAFALRWIRDRDDVDDLLQDVFLSFWRRREALTADVPIRAYLYRAVRNALHNARRDRARDERVTQRGVDLQHVVATTDDDGQRALEHDELRVAIERAVAALPDRCREAWILVRERGLSYAEAAHVLGVAPGTVHTQLSRAFAAVRKAVGPLLGALLLIR